MGTEPTEPVRPVGFGGDWIKGALKFTWESGHKASLVTSLSILVLGAVGNWYHLEHPGGHEKVQHVNLWETMWPALAAAAAVMVVFLLWHLCATPYRLAKAAEMAHTQDLADRSAAHAREMAEAQKAIDAERAAHRQTSERLEVELQKPVEPTHQERLLRAVGSLIADVDGLRPCSYADDRNTTSPEYVRGMLLSHWPHLGSLLDKWDRLLQEQAEAYSEAIAYVDRQTPQTLTGPPGWNHPTVRDGFYGYLSFKNPPELELRTDMSGLGTARVGWVVLTQRFNIFAGHLPAEDAAPKDSDARLQAIATKASGQFKRFFEAMVASDEFKRVLSSRDAMAECHQETSRQLEALGLPEHIYGRCQACQPTSSRSDV